MARHGLRTRPPGGDARAAGGDDEEDADGDGRRIPSVPIPHHTHILPARVRAPYSPPRLRNGSFAHASRSGGPRNLLELQALHPAQPPAPVLYSDCTLLHTGRSTGQRNTTQSSTVLARPVCPHVCDSDSARVTTSSSFSLCSAPSPPLPPPGSQPPRPPLSRGYLSGRGRSRPCRGGQTVCGGRCPVGPQAR